MLLMLDKITRQTHHLLIARKKTVAVAESCTGGMLSAALTSLPQASEYFLLGAITYSNRSKELILDVPAGIIAKHGAVSCVCARLMAENIRKKMRADFGISVTGIAGPSGATPGKSTGTVYIGVAARNKNICRKFIFSGNRPSIRKKAVYKALHLLCAHLSPSNLPRRLKKSWA